MFNDIPDIYKLQGSIRGVKLSYRRAAPLLGVSTTTRLAVVGPHLTATSLHSAVSYGLIEAPDRGVKRFNCLKEQGYNRSIRENGVGYGV
jgi:hypothetical protein